jgi:hypothetical protein
MTRCEVCGNEYDKAFTVTGGRFFCCASCARDVPAADVRDRA